MAVGKYKIVMVRHGESEWNQKNLFCGWYDASLSDKGKGEDSTSGTDYRTRIYIYSQAAMRLPQLEKPSKKLVFSLMWPIRRC